MFITSIWLKADIDVGTELRNTSYFKTFCWSGVKLNFLSKHLKTCISHIPWTPGRRRPGVRLHTGATCFPSRHLAARGVEQASVTSPSLALGCQVHEQVCRKKKKKKHRDAASCVFVFSLCHKVGVKVCFIYLFFTRFAIHWHRKAENVFTFSTFLCFFCQSLQTFLHSPASL